ncbi:MAG: acyltransferase [Nonlabens sp.]|nr:acyltransferase [Nonlabens sp.]
MRYIKQLDSVRAIAVFLVVVSHWLPGSFLINKIPNGQIGVDMFFVLSGFLITTILFHARDQATLTGVSLWNVAKNFYLRRSLRIFPIYYLTIGVLFILGASTGTAIREAFLYFVTYTSNFYFFSIGKWDGMLSHLWSLAVEEQYYLIWPWIVLWVRKKYLLPVIIIFIIIGISSQFMLAGVNKGRLLTFTCFDAFGFGSLLSWIITYKLSALTSFFKILSIVALIILGYFIYGVYVQSWDILSIRTSVSILTIWLITYIYKNLDNGKLRFTWLFNNKFLIFIGKISYGIYLYHLILPVLITNKYIDPYLNEYIEKLFNFKYRLILVLLENTILVVGVSWLSYKLIEAPILKFKNRFEYLTK